MGYPFRQSSRLRGRVRRAPSRPYDGETMTLPLAYSIAETCVVARCSRTTVYEQIHSGKLRAVKRGRRTIVLADDLRAWLDALPAIDVTKGDHRTAEPTKTAEPPSGPMGARRANCQNTIGPTSNAPGAQTLRTAKPPNRCQ